MQQLQGVESSDAQKCEEKEKIVSAEDSGASRGQCQGAKGRQASGGSSAADTTMKTRVSFVNKTGHFPALNSWLP